MLLPRKALAPDHPMRLAGFHQRACCSSWEPGKTLEALDGIFNALDELAGKEVDYYYRRRRRARWISVATRTGAWLFGTLGLAGPMAAVVFDIPWVTLDAGSSALESGYVLLAASAGFLAADSFFGGSAAHVRNVSTQLELERLITEFRLHWLRLRACIHEPGPSESQLESAFELFKGFSAALYSTILRETRLWGKTLTQAIEEFRRQGVARQHAGR